MVNPVNRLTEPEVCTITSGQSLSAAVNLGGRILCGIYMPASWTAAGLTFQGSPDGTTYYNVQSDTAEITVTAAASVFLGLDPVRFFGINFLKVRSGTGGTPVNQGADRALTLMLGKPDVEN
jgi:hypothetical protein